ncbi:pre-B lymphocyte protein 3 isoform X2 [Mustela erminea]|uniref:pre-B lymphocyte protein 3 isoform X2 n=1 Tax=Mustela erminea TaxID=36723 RepID=UPI0013872851|nr:pre-B lymphocyte protein 3 isoform X2 [Mustela erminea]
MACWHLALLLTGTLLSGQVAQLSCMLSPSHATIGEYGVSWYQQRAGSAPRYLLYYRSEDDYHRPPDIPDRFSAATDAAHNACILIIRPVQPEDDADYYCSVAYTS